MPKTVLQYNPVYGKCFAVGGEVEDISAASVHCWEQTLKFLYQNCGGELKSKL